MSGNIRPQSSQLTEPLWIDLGMKSGIGSRELISTSRGKKGSRRGMNCRTFSQNPSKRGKSHHHYRSVIYKFDLGLVQYCLPRFCDVQSISIIRHEHVDLTCVQRECCNKGEGKIILTTLFHVLFTYKRILSR